MGFVVRDLMTRPGIREAKIAAPPSLPGMVDSIVIYACSQADVDWALQRLSEYQSNHPDHFRPEIVPATRPRMTGITTAAQPDQASESFGNYLVHFAKSAMEQQPPPAGAEDFRKRVHAQMQAANIDPSQPDRLNHKP
jgi:hypothetical protein